MIALVNHHVEMGGAEVALLRLVDALGDRHEFEAFLPRAGPLADALRQRGVPVRVIPMPRGSLVAGRGNSLRLLTSLVGGVLSWPAALRALADGLRGADLVLTGSTKAHLYGGLAARMAGRPLAWWLHDVVDRTTFGFLARAVVRAAARYMPHRILAVSRAAALSLKLHGDDARVRVLYNGIRERHRNSGMSGEQLGNCGEPRVGWIGRLVPSKGPDVFLRMAARVSAEIPSARFVLVGGEDPRERAFAESLRRLPDKMGIGDRVELPGYQDDLDAILDHLTVLAFTSVASDSLPTVILEAMSVGVPVVAFAVGGVGEIIETGRSGYTVPAGDEGALAERVLALLGSRPRRRALTEMGRRRIREAFSWDRWVEAWDREIRDLMGSESES